MRYHQQRRPKRVFLALKKKRREKCTQTVQQELSNDTTHSFKKQVCKRKWKTDNRRTLIRFYLHNKQLKNPEHDTIYIAKKRFCKSCVPMCSVNRVENINNTGELCTSKQAIKMK